jgi:hypothetical protein
MSLIRFGIAFVLILVLSARTLAGGHDDVDFQQPAKTPANEEGFPWLCFVTSVASVVGLYVLVRRREQAVETEVKKGRGRLVPWYCRSCNRDVVGAECPRCLTANPFTDDDTMPTKTEKRRKSKS